MGFDYAAKIQALLAKADSCQHLGNDEEASMFRGKAEELMKKYRIAEEEALAVDPTSSAPIAHVILIRTGAQGQGDLAGSYNEIFMGICRHTGVRAYLAPTSGWGMQATVVGYEGDVRYTEFLWTAAFMMFSTRIDPTWDKNRTEDENIFLLRQAGIKRGRIADMAWGNGADPAARSKVQRIYKREAARRGEDISASGLGFNSSNYRQAYADGFTSTLLRRLKNARDAADSVGGGLVLHGRADRVNEAFYARFPQMRPSTEPATPWVDPRTTCPKKACQEGRWCQDHMYLKPRGWTRADQARWESQQYGSSARAGRSSGATAAEGVVISRTERAGRLDPSGVAIEG